MRECYTPDESLSTSEEMNGIDKCTIKDSGLNLKDSVCIVFKNNKISMFFVNKTNERYELPEVYMVVRVTCNLCSNHLYLFIQ